MANTINKVFVDKMGGRKSAQYIGVKGELFYDPEIGDLRVSDGVTVGGKPTGAAAALGIYRHYQAGCNIFRNTNDQDIAQIFIHNAMGKVDYINYTPDTDNDDFYVTGLQHNDQSADSSWVADRIVVLNVYSMAGGDLAVGDLRSFVRKFIDTVLYTPEDEAVNNVQQAKDQFYANIESLTAALPAGSLFENFAFDDDNRVHYPEYNGPQNNTSANFKVFITPSWAWGANYSNNSLTRLLMLSSGSGYSVGEQIVINGGQLGGVDDTNDLTITIDSVKSGNITGLNLVDGGSGFWPNPGNAGSAEGVNGGSGYGAALRITQCDSNGVIQAFELRNGGYNYQVDDTLTLNFGGTDATFVVTSVGTNGIDEYSLSGTAYIGSPAKVPNGYWPAMSISDGNADQYDGGNWISTNRSSNGLIANITGYKMTIVGGYNEGLPLAPGMYITLRNPNVVGQLVTAQLVSQSSNDSTVWYINQSLSFDGAQVRVDGIPYGGGNVQESYAFGGGTYVTVFDQSIFAMIAFDANTNSVYYNGNMGADSSGTKDIEVLFGINGGSQDSVGITQRLVYDQEYTITTADAGKHIYNPNGNNTLYIPPETTANFPVGTAITFVSAAGNPTWVSRQDSNATQVWGAGFDTQSDWWAIPSNSMGTILKIGPDKWIVSGAGLFNDA